MRGSYTIGGLGVEHLPLSRVPFAGAGAELGIYPLLKVVHRHEIHPQRLTCGFVGPGGYR